MDTLPLELHAQILEAACVDDGSTARSLSLVSRYIREVSKPFLYQSVAVSGLDALATLAKKLYDLPPHLRRIRHLFLSDHTYKSLRERSILTVGDANEQAALEEAAFLRIIHYAAPTLETLALSVFCPLNGSSVFGAVFSMTFPRLTHLSVHGFYPFPHTPNTTPRLRELRLSGNRNPHGLLEMGGLSAACPALVHLEIAGLASAVSFASEVRSALLAKANVEDALLSHPDPPPLLPATFPPTLQLLRVEHLPSPPSRSKVAQQAHEKMKMLLNVGEMRELRFEVVECPIDDLYSRLRSNWLAGEK
ncbi:hypothetical protein EIP91_004943 [Steccherinum ochraceum]|uniref:F-box domain-containing protein n=1 Tax=Steccherinum ochraceum TaxID=92696 RepID=A0A4R0R8J2_9APHY|nr:hypothetical protein EIP91_004943 [Steccherinum ochraceum]